MYRRFKGTNSEYRALHYWVEEQLGKPMECSKCGSTGRTRYHWSNISNEYKQDITDWVRLCVPCHFAIDGNWAEYWLKKTHCSKGHDLSITGTYVRSDKRPICRQCKRDAQRAYKKRRIEKEKLTIKEATNG